ncbi:carbohydrate ABC transporter permease [Aeromicrobium sp. 50.2.37]|uniref:carbohydrate ABC transporter permease n=1 Tax=Aeromicrobium sp. 50.2.37 TaxID=2969305 RepID=UPI0021500506|nr:sugar ABC transporter permease [Aeromicrobium sp. 50.2.37]MCR4512914.1 sugar ABC transporter permease [Aeromicrobium sp. 50.2.37]
MSTDRPGPDVPDTDVPDAEQPHGTDGPDPARPQAGPADHADAELVDDAIEPEGHDLEPIGAPPTRRRRRRRQGAVPPGRRRSGWPMLAPSLVVLLGLTLWPLGLAVWSSLRRSSLTVPDDTFVGLDNLTGLLGDRQWWVAVSVTLLLVASAVLLQLLLGSILAAAVRRLAVPAAVVAVLLLVPFAMLPVLSATIWRDALTTGVGPAWFGYDGGATAASALAVVGSEVWRGTGITALILLVGLARVDLALLDSAIADGATWWQRLRRVTWPAAGPAVAVAVLYRSLDALRALEGPLLADPRDGLRTVPVLLWDTTFGAFEVGLASAIAVLLLLLAALVAGALVAVLRPGRNA